MTALDWALVLLVAFVAGLTGGVVAVVVDRHLASRAVKRVLDRMEQRARTR